MSESNLSDLHTRHCEACHSGIPPLETESIEMHLASLCEWQLNADNQSILREFRFTNYYETIAFVNALAWIAHREDHHPDLEVGYNRCLVTYSTHAIGGLSINDFICAAKIDQLLNE